MAASGVKQSEEPGLSQRWEAECGQPGPQICGQDVPRQKGALGEEGWGRKMFVKFRQLGPAFIKV